MWDLFSCFLNTPYFANILQLLRDRLQVLPQTSRVINCRHYPKNDCKSALVNFCGLPIQCLSPNSKFIFPEFHETFNICNTSNQNIYISFMNHLVFAIFFFPQLEKEQHTMQTLFFLPSTQEQLKLNTEHSIPVFNSIQP